MSTHINHSTVYKEQANIYKFRGELVKGILENVKEKYQNILTGSFGASKINNTLSYNYNINASTLTLTAMF